MSRHTKSEIWRYFEYVNLDSAKCNKCGKLYSRKGRTTTSLKNHLRSSHPQEFLDFLSKDMARLENKSDVEICNLLKAKPMDKQKHGVLINENATTSTSASGVSENFLCKSNELKRNCDHIARTLESNDSYSTDAITLSPTIIKQEVFIEPDDLQPANLSETNNPITKESERQSIFNDEGNDKKLSSPSQNLISQTKDEKYSHHCKYNSQIHRKTLENAHESIKEPEDPLDVPVLNEIFKEDDEFVEPLPKIRRDSSNDYFNEPTYDFEALQHKQSTKDLRGISCG